MPAVHIPVLLDEVLMYLDPKSGGTFIDATVGAGGHSRAILERTSPAGRLLGLDQDEKALQLAAETLASFGSRAELASANFADIGLLARSKGFSGVDGILADLGISSMMVDDPARGASFLREGPLDMRMDRRQALTAADIINRESEKEIADILYRFGEERRSRPLARAIVRARPLSSTTELVRVIERVMGRPRFGKIHPATRTFQALRIAVNAELDCLTAFLSEAPSLIRPGGRLVVISFHSLEDRLVKNRFREIGQVRTKKIVTPGPEEVRRNPRARSARLRCVEIAQADEEAQ